MESRHPSQSKSRYAKIRTLATLLTTLIVLIPFQNCSKMGTAPKAELAVANTSSLDLYSNDMSKLHSGNLLKGVAQVETDYNGAFTKVFGGTSPTYLQAYLDARVKSVFTESQLDQFDMTPGTFHYMGWLNKLWRDPRFRADDKGLTMATNMGTLLFLEGQLEGSNYTLIAPSGQTYTVDSTRDGLVVLGPGYAEEDPRNGMDFPLELRLGTLIHEGRHSDCTGGVLPNFINLGRTADSHSELLIGLDVDQILCGHTHVDCPAGHELEFIAACDANVWSAYGVETIFSLANLANKPNGTLDRLMLEAIASDNIGRLPANGLNLLKTTSPDMSHTGGL